MDKPQLHTQRVFFLVSKNTGFAEAMKGSTAVKSQIRAGFHIIFFYSLMHHVTCSQLFSSKQLSFFCLDKMKKTTKEEH